MLISIKKAKPPHKYAAKFLIHVPGKNPIYRTIKFGADGASDYTIHGDEKRKAQYLKRHQKNESWDKPFTAGALSRWILWNKKTLVGSIADYKKRFGL